MLTPPLVLAWLLHLGPVLAAPPGSEAHNTALARGCAHSADSRGCWSDGFDISTNYYEEVPDTGVVREYWLEIVNTTAAPDGIPRIVQCVNGTVPGPTIIADWGDTVVVHVKNSLQNNGTGIHFHGIRQNYTNQMDGVPSVTQCPIAPGGSFTYRWRATQYGSTWYHSHFSLQAWDGVFGGIVINGPSTADYDEDLGVLFLNDWYHETAVVQTARAMAVDGLPPPTLESGLINGTNTFTTNNTDAGGNNISTSTYGSRFETRFAPGKRYRIRLVNGAADSHFKFSIDEHRLRVMASDLVPIHPYTTDFVSIAMGQRYDVVVQASADPRRAYWLRAVPVANCSHHYYPDNIKGIVRYEEETTTMMTGSDDLGEHDDEHDHEQAAKKATTSGDPDTSAYAAIGDDVMCVDEDPSLLVPYVALDAAAPADMHAATEADIDVELAFAPGHGNVWTMSGNTFVSPWERPTVMQVGEHQLQRSKEENPQNGTASASTWTPEQNVVRLPRAREWTYFVVETGYHASHPLHLHGHDFWVLGAGAGTFDRATARLRARGVPRRDVVMLPPNGWVAFALFTDNPGAWLMHCHIAWHTAEGLAIQLVEREDEFADVIDSSTLEDVCSGWNRYVAAEATVQDDSGV